MAPKTLGILAFGDPLAEIVADQERVLKAIVIVLGRAWALERKGQGRRYSGNSSGTTSRVMAIITRISGNPTRTKSLNR